MRRDVSLFCPSLKKLFKCQSILNDTLIVSVFKFHSEFILSAVCVCAGWHVATWRGGWALSSAGSRPSRRRQDSLTWATRLPPPTTPSPHFPAPLWSLLLSFCLLLLQLLLCVGQFFGTTAEAEEEWRQYKSGAKKGKERSLLVTKRFSWPRWWIQYSSVLQELQSEVST